MDQSEDLPRPVGSYDPDEPLIVRYADVIAARNAVAQLINALTDQQNLPSEYRRQSVMFGVAAGVAAGVMPDGQSQEFATFEEAVRFLAGLRDRLGGSLPFPGPGPRRS